MTAEKQDALYTFNYIDELDQPGLAFTAEFRERGPEGDKFLFDVHLSRDTIRALSALIVNSSMDGGYWQLVSDVDKLVWSGEVQTLEYIDPPCGPQEQLHMLVTFRLYGSAAPAFGPGQPSWPHYEWIEPVGMVTAALAGCAALAHVIIIIEQNPEPAAQGLAVGAAWPFLVSYAAAFILGVVLVWWNELPETWGKVKAAWERSWKWLMRK